MSITELRYVLETAACGSINGAAKKLSIAQSNISRAISNLESEYGVKIFERSAKGVTLSREGQKFLEHSRRIVDEVDCLKMCMTSREDDDVKLKVILPKSNYPSYAFANFVKRIEDTEHMDLHIRECSSIDALEGIFNQDYHIALIRFDASDEDSYRAIIRARGMEYEEILHYQLRIVVNQDSPIAKQEIKGYGDLKGYIELRQGDAKKLNGKYIDTLATPENVHSDRRIQIYDRGDLFALLNRLENAYMWVSPVPKKILELNGLVQKECKWQEKWMKDVLVYPNRALRTEEMIFIEELKKWAKEVCR